MVDNACDADIVSGDDANNTSSSIQVLLSKFNEEQLTHFQSLKQSDLNIFYDECLKYLIKKYEQCINSQSKVEVYYEIEILPNLFCCLEQFDVHPVSKQYLSERNTLFTLRNFIFEAIDFNTTKYKMYIPQLLAIWIHYNDYLSIIKSSVYHSSIGNAMNYMGSSEIFDMDQILKLCDIEEYNHSEPMIKMAIFLVEHKKNAHVQELIDEQYHSIQQIISTAYSELKPFRKQRRKNKRIKKKHKNEQKEYISLDEFEQLLTIYLAKRCRAYLMICAGEYIDDNVNGLKMWENAKYPSNVDPNAAWDQNNRCWDRYLEAQIYRLIKKQYDSAIEYYFFAACSDLLYIKLLSLKYLSKTCYINGQYLFGKIILKCTYKLCGTDFFPTFTNYIYPKMRKKFIAKIRNMKCANCHSVDKLSRLKVCIGCMKIAYCSRLCQKIDWKYRHNQVCDKKWKMRYLDLQQILFQIL